MPKYIEADWLIQKLSGWRKTLAETYGEDDEYVCCLDEVMIRLDDAPTDKVLEVVRCKDCKYATGWTTKNGLYGGLTCESLVDMDVDEDFFCAFGEMKEKESVK